MGATIGINADERAEAEQILNAGQDRATLKIMREETTLLVLMVRVAVQERREEWQAKQTEQEAAETALDGPLFAGEETE
jgi:hypothetical protein